MLTRVIAHSAGFRPLQLTHDDELDAALALGGYVDLPRGVRYCFQTTYLNERHMEYRLLGPQQRLIWVLRNPYSVIRSMVYNWRRWALNELFEGCREAVIARMPELDVRGRWLYGPSKLQKACIAYVGKTAQLLRIRELVPTQRLMVVDYDEIIQSPGKWVPRIYSFIGEPYNSTYASIIRADSLDKADRLTASQRRLIERVAVPIYEECLRFRSAAENGN